MSENGSEHMITDADLLEGVSEDGDVEHQGLHSHQKLQIMLPLSSLFTITDGRILADTNRHQVSRLLRRHQPKCQLPWLTLLALTDGSVVADDCQR